MIRVPHVLLVPLSGFRIREQQLRELGMTLPGLAARGNAIAGLPSLGLLTLAGATPPHWNVEYLPAQNADDDTVESISQQQPTLVAISALTASVNEAYRLSDKLRQRGISTVLGGLHATACPDEATRHCDAAVTGSGELVWHRVLADAEAGTLEPIYRASPTETPPWPMPRFDLLGPHPPRYTLQTQRGCTLACEFCGASRLLGSFAEKPVDAIRSELNAIASVSPKPLLELSDDNTFAGNRDVEPLLDALKQSGARWFTEADWRIGEDPRLLASLAASGCKQVLVGIESLVFRYPGQGRKQAELERVINAVEALQQSGVVVNGCFIVGAEGETQESIERLTEFLLECPLAEIQVTLQTPFPGTGLFTRLQREGRLLENRDWSHYTLFDVTYEPDSMTVDELESGFRNLLSNVYSQEASQRRHRIRKETWKLARNKPA